MPGSSGVSRLRGYCHGREEASRSLFRARGYEKGVRFKGLATEDERSWYVRVAADKAEAPHPKLAIKRGVHEGCLHVKLRYVKWRETYQENEETASISRTSFRIP